MGFELNQIQSGSISVHFGQWFQSKIEIGQCTLLINACIMFMSLLTEKHEVWVREQMCFLLTNCPVEYKNAKATYIYSVISVH